MEAAAVYVPGGRAPYPSTVVMGVVTARAAGVLDVVVCSPPGADGEIDKTILGAVPVVRRRARVQDRRRAGDRRAGVRDRDGRPRRRDRRPGQPVRAGGQAPALGRGRDRRLRGAERPRDGDRRGGRRAGVELAALDLLAQAEHGAGSLVVAIAASARDSGRAGADARAPGRGAPDGGRRGVRARRGRRTRGGRWSWRTSSRPSTWS